MDGADGQVEGAQVVTEHWGQVITVVAVESEVPCCCHAFVNAITSFLGSAWSRTTVRCPVITPFTSTKWPRLETVAGVQVISI